MLGLVICALLVSLSDVINPKTEATAQASSTVGVIEEHTTASWAAVLGSFLMPLACTLFVITIKHANETLKLASYDFTIAYWGIASLVF